MKDEKGRQALLEFAKQEHSEENLLFYEKALTFRKSYEFKDAENLREDEIEKMRREAMMLIELFLKEDSELALNLPHSNPFKKGFLPSVTPAPNMFDSICRIVHKMIEQDVFPRFRVSSIGSELLAKFPQLANRLSGTNTNRSTSTY